MQNLLTLLKDLTLHPQNISELKGLILQLAVQGKLTSSWRASHPEFGPDGKSEGDNSATALLEKIKAEKERLIKEKKIKKEKPLPEITEDEIPYELPEGWEWSRLNEVSEYIQRGKSPKYTEVEKIPVVSQKCVQWSGFDISRARFITEESLEKYGNERFLRDGDLLWNSTGDGTIGRIIEFPGSTYKQVVADSHVTVVRSFKKWVLPGYVWVFTASPLIQSIVAGRVSGSTKQTELGTSTVKSLEFSLPPLEEQKAIVATVNKLFKEVDELAEQVRFRMQLKEDYVTSACRQLTENTQATWNELTPHFQEFFDTKPNIKKLRETILQLAVQGKLTSNWRSRHPELCEGSHSAAALLKKIKAEKEQLIKEKKINGATVRKEKPLPEINEDEFPYELPEGWVWCRLDDIVNIIGGVAKGKKGKETLKATPYLRVANVQRGYLDLTIIKEILVSETDYNKYQLEPEDLLMIEGGDPDKLGRCAIWKNEIPGCIHQNHVFRVRQFNKVLNPYFLMLFINSPVSRGYYESCSKRTTNLASINKTQMRSTPIALPPSKEQKAIVEKVNALMAFCDQLEEAVTTSEQQVMDLMKSVLKEATTSPSNNVSYTPDESLSMAAEEGGEYGE